MPKISKHGKRRIKQRVGVTSGAATIYTKKALRHGIKYEDTLGNLNKWLSGKIYLHRTSNTHMRVYKGFLYVISADGALVTVFAIPDEYKDHLEQYVNPTAYAKYEQHLNESVYVNNKKAHKRNLEKYEKKRHEFKDLILLNDIRKYVDGRYDVKIVGITTETKKIVVRYVPLKMDAPDMSELISYIREHTWFKVVRLVHAKGADGRKRFEEKYTYDPYEDELVYRC